MSDGTNKTVARIKAMACVALVVWGAYAWWSLRQARRAGGALVEALTESWPTDGGPRYGTRESLAVAAQKLQDGDFAGVRADLRPTKALTSERKMAALRFLEKSPELRRRFLAASSAAQAQEADGADVAATRQSLARALVAAAAEDTDSLAAHVLFAEAALDQGGATGRGGSGPKAVAEIIREIGPAFNLGRDLMTEGHAAADKLVSRASRYFQAKQYDQAVALMRLAAEVLGVELSTPVKAVTPTWFDALAKEPTDGVTPVQAEAAVQLAEAMSMSGASKPVKALILRARREFDAGRAAEAYWWSSVALNALGMTDDAIANSTLPQEDAPDEEPDEELAEDETPE